MKLPTYYELKEALKINSQQVDFILQSRETVKDILNGKDSRLLLIVGPCSIHDVSAAKEFAQKLKKLATEISDQFFVLMRVYCEKPRTINGWKGFLYDPFLDGSTQIQAGITQTRQLLLDLADSNVPAATEFLDPLTAYYYEDLITWGSIGARTSSSQTHRQLASSISIPIGIKNGIAGNISSAINGVMTASTPHTFIGIDKDGFKSIIRSLGNPDAHVVLRGGESGPNYDKQSIEETLASLDAAKLPLRLIVDCSHHNSNKTPLEQISVLKNVLLQIHEGNPFIRGMMLESHLFSGNQVLTEDPQQLQYGISITDPCLNWDLTASSVRWATNFLREKTHSEIKNFENLAKR